MVNDLIKWEYQYVHYNTWTDNASVPLLNEAGLEGWEATGHVRETRSGISFLMKRPLVEKVKDPGEKWWLGEGHCTYFYHHDEIFCNHSKSDHGPVAHHPFLEG